jgi:glutamate racemase
MGPGPIGLFDSGVGGLSVAREIRRELPAEDLLYVADSAYCPYGDREPGEVRERALAVGRHLQGSGAKLVVAACNTATGAALESLRQALSIPVIGLEPAVKTGARLTRNRKIGVMATSGTLRSERFARLVQAHAVGVEVVPQPCPGLADAIESGALEGELLQGLLGAFVEPLRRAGVDTVVLGCTHYAFIQEPLARLLGPDVQLVDSAPAIARRVREVLEAGGLNASPGTGTLRLLTTGEPSSLERRVGRLWPEPFEVEAVVL